MYRRTMNAPARSAPHVMPGCTWTMAFSRSSEGDFAGAAAEFRRALACRPHDPDIHAALAGVLFDARDYAAARSAINAALAIDSRDVESNRLAGNLDYIEEHWADAIARFRYVAASDPDRVKAGYGQLMYWLAQRAPGSRNPNTWRALPAMAGRNRWYCTCAASTPRPSSSCHQGRRFGFELTAEYQHRRAVVRGAVLRRRGNTGRAANPKWARQYFAALVNIRVLYFIEHGLALAEITKLR